MTWHHLHYLLGLTRLGHRVTFLEDSAWAAPWDPARGVADGDPTYGIAHLQRCLAAVGLADLPWCYVSRHVVPGPTHFGMSGAELHAALRRADLYVAVSGVTPWHDSRPRPRRTLGVDTDPVYTQARIDRDGGELAAYWADFDRAASFGTRLGGRWHPTRQPVVADRWDLGDPPAGAAFTTIGQWEHAAERHVTVGGRRLVSGKGAGWRLLRDLDVAVPRTMAMGGMPDAERASFAAAGWGFADPAAASASLDSFDRFVAGSLGELTPAKEIYAATACGWFSDRAACYLAAGRPVVCQETGFGTGPLALPVGEGLFAWRAAADAAAAVRAVMSDWPRHSRAARSVAAEHLSYDRVLPPLVEYAMS